MVIGLIAYSIYDAVVAAWALLFWNHAFAVVLHVSISALAA
jgi:hypothetical protein